MPLLPDSGASIDLSPRAKIILRGPDRTRYLQGQITNDLARLDPGQTIEACLCNAKGKLEAHVFVREITFPIPNAPGKSETVYLIDAHPDLANDDFLLNRLDKYLIADDCELADATNDFHLLHLIPPPETPPQPKAPDDTFSFHATRFGLPGIDLLANSLHDTISPPPNLPVLTDERAAALRIIHGTPTWGRELNPDILPPEAGPDFIERNISYTKGCYIGQETISRLKSVGRVNKQLAALITPHPPSETPPSPGWNLFPESDPESKPVGTLTSTALHPGLNTTIALAFVKTAHLTPGTRLLAAPPGTNPQISPCETVEIRETPIRQKGNIP
ncbi:MAG: hypothetical protein AAF591_21180 [Verrucomicrobiota bacterium]